MPMAWIHYLELSCLLKTRKHLPLANRTPILRTSKQENLYQLECWAVHVISIETKMECSADKKQKRNFHLSHMRFKNNHWNKEIFHLSHSFQEQPLKHHGKVKVADWDTTYCCKFLYIYFCTALQELKNKRKRKLQYCTDKLNPIVRFKGILIFQSCHCRRRRGLIVLITRSMRLDIWTSNI